MIACSILTDQRATGDRCFGASVRAHLTVTVQFRPKIVVLYKTNFCYTKRCLQFIDWLIYTSYFLISMLKLWYVIIKLRFVVLICLYGTVNVYTFLLIFMFLFLRFKG